MLTLPTETEVLDKVLAWANARDDIRAVIITSSRVRPGGPVDLLSDYDIVLAVTDVDRFALDEAWINEVGRLMVLWGDQHQMYGLPAHFRGAIYADYVKIDWGIWPVAMLERIAAAPSLPDELDVGYKVLVDKDALTTGWRPPSYRAHIPAKPTEKEYRAIVDEFWWIATYVAKSLWRDELVFARFCLDQDMRLGVLRKMLEWRIELDHDWSVKPGVLGRGLKKRLPADIWAELEATFVGPDLEENWAALFRLGALFRRVAREVGAALGYAYPEAVDAEVSGWLRGVHEMARGEV